MLGSRHFRRAFPALATASALGCGIGIASLLGAGSTSVAAVGPATRGGPAAHATHSHRVVPAVVSLTRHFAIFRRTGHAAATGEALPASVVTHIGVLDEFAASPIGRFGPEAALANYAGSFSYASRTGPATNNVQVWVMPAANGGVCWQQVFIVNGLGGTACAGATQAAEGNMIETSLDPTSGVTVAAMGLAPDGNATVEVATTSGTVLIVPVVSNVWSVRATGIVTVTLIDGSGSSRVISL